MPCTYDGPRDPHQEADLNTMARLACLHCRTVSVPEWAAGWWARHKTRDRRDAAWDAVQKYLDWLKPWERYLIFEGRVLLFQTVDGWRAAPQVENLASTVPARSLLLDLVNAMELPEDLELDDLTEFIFDLLKQTTVQKP